MIAAFLTGVLVFLLGHYAYIVESNVLASIAVVLALIITYGFIVGLTKNEKE